MTVSILQLPNQIEPFYLQYSSHTDGYNSRYVDTTAILQTPCALSMVDVSGQLRCWITQTEKQTSLVQKNDFNFHFWHPTLVRPARKWLFCRKAKNGLGRFAPSALPHYYLTNYLFLWDNTPLFLFFVLWSFAHAPFPATLVSGSVRDVPSPVWAC